MRETPPKPFTLRLDAAVQERLDAYARKTRRTRNAAVNQLLESALDHVDAGAAES
jgi:predicted transcriptional regulator